MALRTLIPILLFVFAAISGFSEEVVSTNPDPLNSATDVAASSADDASIFNRKNARTIQLEIPAPRGQITDREGKPFAQNRVAYQLAVQYEQFPKEDRDAIVAWGRDRVEMAKQLWPAVSEPSDEQLYQHYRHRRWLPYYISSHLSADEKAQIEPKLTRGLVLQPVYQRYYPEKSVASHIIGYTGLVGKMETGPINPLEPLWIEGEGRAGFEKIYDNELKGKPAALQMIFDENGNQLLNSQKGRPRSGGTVVSTLNLRWQKRAEEVLDSHSRRGAIVVIDVATGEVLVMASKPSFDLNKWIPGISQKDYDVLRESDDKPLYARAFQGRYPPASSFKPIVALAALNEGTITPSTTVYCPAYISYGNHKLWNWSRSPYGDLSVKNAIKWSNNPWFAQVGNRVGSGEFLGLARRLGYGTTSGLPLIGEESGLIPTAEYVQKTLGRPITEGDAANWSIGQGAVLATPLQVAQGMAGIANGGALPKLHLMMQVQDTFGRVIRTAQPERRNWLGIEQEALDTVRDGMREVVAGGTGRSAGLSWTEVCGKTGTGQWGPESKSQGVAWFAGFLPYDQPRLAFACLYEGRPGQKVSGSGNACPMVPAFFNSFKDEIQEMVAPAPKAVMIVDELEVQEDTEGVLRAIPVSPLELEEAFPDGIPEEIEAPAAVPVEIEEDVAPRAIPVNEDELRDSTGGFEPGP
ncbi:penicillin-binding transpeptidase domain-containing protein [Haloferula chungangensis]|uniref:Penicillin-binding transpeptidase domain-containing protein n=1 Tax=Haloferula chungangensis TaxID=1048331 RepID=A0ABW2L4J5_9BACT